MFIKLKHYLAFCSSINPNSLSSTKRFIYYLSLRLYGLNSSKVFFKGIKFTFNWLWFVSRSCLPKGSLSLYLGEGFNTLFFSSCFFKNADYLLLIGIFIFMEIGSFYYFISNILIFLINGLSADFSKFYALLLYFFIIKLFL